MHWLTDWSRHFKFNSSNFMFSLFRWVGANIAYVLNARGILALPSLALLWKTCEQFYKSWTTSAGHRGSPHRTNIAYVLNARGILALPSFGKRASSFSLLWQHSSSATTTTQPFIQFPREVIVNSIIWLLGLDSQLGPSWWKKLLTAGVKLPETKADHDLTKT